MTVDFKNKEFVKRKKEINKQKINKNCKTSSSKFQNHEMNDSFLLLIRL